MGDRAHEPEKGLKVPIFPRVELGILLPWISFSFPPAGFPAEIKSKKEKQGTVNLSSLHLHLA